MSEKLATVFVTLIAVFLCLYGFVLPFREAVNEFIYAREVVDQETDYENRKLVEDTARSMIANYEYASGDYETYKVFCETDQYDKDRCQRALDAKSSANKTASTYNNYILKNKYLFKGNLPADIYYELQKIN